MVGGLVAMPAFIARLPPSFLGGKGHQCLGPAAYLKPTASIALPGRALRPDQHHRLAKPTIRRRTVTGLSVAVGHGVSGARWVSRLFRWRSGSKASRTVDHREGKRGLRCGSTGR
eukprot:3172631-Amphidinium_carterae.1